MNKDRGYSVFFYKLPAMKNEIRQYLKDKKLITTSLGEVKNISHIGEGGNGLVFRGAIHENDVAIKILAASGSTKLERFKAEYLFMNLIPKSSLINQPIHYEEIQMGSFRVPMILMQLYSGHLVRPTDNPTTDNVVQLCNFLLDAMEHIHSNGVIHRDIKPQNILLSDSSYCLSDFGIASYNPEQFPDKKFWTRSGERLANWVFSAPEQATGASPHETMDIYAFGQILQWFVSGNVHRGTQRTPLMFQDENLQWLDSVVDRSLANNPQNRYQNVTEIREDIDEWQRGENNPYRPYIESGRVWRVLSRFNRSLGKTYPKQRGEIISTSNQKMISNLLTNIKELAMHETHDDLWWFTGRADQSINQLENLGNIVNRGRDVWLIEDMEVIIEQAFVFYESGEYRSTVLLKLLPMPSFGIYDEKTTETDEAALLDRETYITISERDVGFAEIDGTTVDLSNRNVELRSRNLQPTGIFIATKFSNALRRESEQHSYRLIKRIEEGTFKGEEEFETYLENIRQNLYPTVSMTL